MKKIDLAAVAIAGVLLMMILYLASRWIY